MPNIPLRLIAIMTLLGAALGVGPLQPARAGAPAVTEFPIAVGAVARYITLGPDGNLWFTEGEGNRVGRLTPAGRLTEFSLPTRQAHPDRIVVGPDQNLWFTEPGMSQVGRITPAGVITEFPLGPAIEDLRAITVGPDGALWLSTSSALWRLTTAGVATRMPANTSGPITGLTIDHNGTFWVSTEYRELPVSQIGRFTPGNPSTWTAAGVFYGHVGMMVAAADGEIWFTVPNIDEVARLRPDNAIEFFPFAVTPLEIFPAADGTAWITTSGSDNALRQLTTDGRWRDIAIPGTSGYGQDLVGLTQTPDGAIWFPDSENSRIGRLVPAAFPADDLPMQGQPLLFLATGHVLEGEFRVYWEAHGGLALQGYPLTDQFTEVSALDSKPYTVQYFERAVFEQHPENAPPYDMLLTQLGTYRYKQLYPQGAPNQQRNPNNPHDFAQTGHTVGGSFRPYWEQHGGLAQFGYPLSDEFTETSALDGQTYTVQYFERAVFEWHPENAAPYNVLLSQLGTYRLHELYPQGPPRP